MDRLGWLLLPVFGFFGSCYGRTACEDRIIAATCAEHGGYVERGACVARWFLKSVIA